MFFLFRWMLNISLISALSLVSANVSQCYLCNSVFCGNDYDPRYGEVASCSDVYKNAKLYSSRIVASPSNTVEDSKISLNNTEDIETLTSQDSDQVIKNQTTHSDIFDIQRKFWDLFNKGEVDENTQFVCVKAHYYSENSQTKTYRGCVPKYTKSISTACEYVNQKVAGVSTSTVYGCYTCESNLCNSGINLDSSILAMFLGIILKIVI